MPFGFADGQFDSDSALVRFGKRDFDPFAGRWTAKDPVRFHGRQANLLIYTGDDPVNQRDSSGLAVDICERLALNPALQASGVNHQWIRTSTMEVGIGGTREETEVDSESGEGAKPGASCYTVSNVDEDCVNNILTNEFGQMPGPWVPFSNDCVTFVDDVINMCTVSWNP
jgi:RHS repeat-associated protein